MLAMADIAPLSSVTVGGLDFKWNTYSRRGEISVHTTGADGRTVILSVSAGYDSGEYFAKASHWLSDTDTKCPDGLTPILSFHVAQGPDPVKLAEMLASISFERVTHLGTDWIISSTGDAGAIDQFGEVIKVLPRDDGSWRWERECHAFRAFYDATGAALRMEGHRSPTREAAMGEALAAREKVRGALATLATAFGINVVS